MIVNILQMKRALRAALLVLLLGAVGVTKAFAHQIVGNLRYEIISISERTAKVMHYEYGSGSLVIPETVPLEYIDHYEYNYNHQLVPVYVTDSFTVISIDEWAFYNCDCFTGSLTIPNSVTSIGEHAFQGCSGFSGTLTIPNSVTWIGHCAFKDCSGFSTVYYDADLSVNYDWNDTSPFVGCEGSLTIGDNVEMIPDCLFRRGAFTGSLIIPNSLTTIGQGAFAGCDGFTGGLTIGNSVTEIGRWAFADCNGFTGSLTIGNSVEIIGIEAFAECDGFTGSLIIPNSVTSIGSGAFSGCSGFTGDLTIPNSVTMIEGMAFSGCSGFTGNLTIGNSVTMIGGKAFEGCSGFTGSLTIGNSVEIIGVEAFAGKGFTGSLIIPNSVTSIGSGAFSGCIGFTGNLTIGNSVTTIGDSAFEGCSGFTGNLTIGNSVTTIGHSAFINCGIFSVINYNPTNASDCGMTNPPFYGCSGHLILGNSVQRIPSNMFRDANFTGNLVIPNSVTSIGSGAFYYCNGFTGNLTIPNSVTFIGLDAFRGCNGFTGNLTISNSVTVIYNFTFGDCSGFTGSLTIPNSVTKIEYSAFRGCSGFTGDLTILNSVASIGPYAFEDCSGFTGSLIIPASVDTIGREAFRGCSGFTSLYAHRTTPPVALPPYHTFDDMDNSIPVYVPCGSAEAYRYALGWGYFTNYYEEDCEHNITAIANPSDGGTTTGSGAYSSGSLATLTATASDGYIFINWTKNETVVSTNAMYSFAVTEDGIYVANFAEIGSGGSTLYCSISASSNVENGGSVSGSGYYFIGQTCALSATANYGYTFTNWTENDEVVSTEATYSFIVTGERTLVANFEQIEIETLIFEPFEEYTAGNKIAQEALAAGHNWWTTWSNAPGSAEDGVVANFDGTQCGHLVYGNDQVLLLGDVDNGNYDLDFDILVPEGKNGYFNILHHFAGGNSTWAMQCYLHMTNDGPNSTHAPGHGTIHAGSNSTADVPCVYDAWMHFRLNVDTDTDIARYYYTAPGEDEILVCEWQWSLDSFGESVVGRTLAAMDFYPPHNVATSEFYIDNFSFKKNGGDSAPELSITPNSISETLGEDEMATVDITIHNSGNSIGEWIGWLDFGEGGAGSQTAELYYHDGEVGSGVGSTSECTREMAIRVPGNAYAGAAVGMKISSVDYYISPTNKSADDHYTFRIYGQGIYGQPGELIAEKTVYSSDLDTWISATFDEDIYLTGQTIWATVELLQAADEYPMSMDTGDYGEEYDGNWLSTNGGNFNHCYSAGSFGGAWMINVNCEGTLLPATWASINRNEGVIWSGDDDIITLTLNTIGLEQGTYNANLIINTNDANMAHVEIPVTLYYGDDTPHTDITQATDFNAGWNWWSTYIDLEDLDGLQMLEEGLGDNGLMIKSQNDGYASYLSGYGWYGSLTSINNESTYQVRAGSNCTVEFTSPVAIPANHPITLHSGWTWIGYPVNASMSVEDAFVGITPQNGDMLKSQNNGYASYLAGFGWYGSLNTLNPGMGLMFKSNANTDVTLYYPDSGTRSDLKANQTTEGNHWQPNLNAYADNMSVMAVVELDGIELQGESYELAAFANGVVRGSARLLYVEPLNRYMAFLTVAGDEAAELNFGLYDSETGAVEMQCLASLPYETNAVIGSFDEPYVVSFRSTTGMDEWASSLQVFPNPVEHGRAVSLGFDGVETSKVTVEIINALGSVVETLRATSLQRITAPEAAGVYTLRISIEGKGTCYRKLIVR